MVCSMKLELAVLLNSSNLPPSLRLIMRFILELQCFVHDHATHTGNEKLWSKGVAMHAYSDTTREPEINYRIYSNRSRLRIDAGPV